MKKTVQLGIVSAMCLSTAAFSGCASPGKRTAIGAGAGAAVGGAMGGATGGWRGAAIGAGIGALAGGSVGNYLDKQAQQLNQVAETHRTADGILVKLKNDLLFDSGSSVLKPEATETLTQLGDILAQYPDDRIRIGGHTDNKGALSMNEELSMKRAKSVQEILGNRGVKPTQMLPQGYGPTRPISNNKSETGRAQNRRVELKIDVPQAQQG